MNLRESILVELYTADKPLRPYQLRDLLDTSWTQSIYNKCIKLLAEELVERKIINNRHSEYWLTEKGIAFVENVLRGLVV